MSDQHVSGTERFTVSEGQTWRCDESAAKEDAVPDAHDSVELWADYPRFSATVDEIVGDVAALVVGTSNSHPRAPDLGDRVDVHVDKLIEGDRWSPKRGSVNEAGCETIYVAGRSDGGGGARKAHTNEDCPALKEARTVMERDRGAYPGEIDWCQWCTGDVEQPDTQDVSHYNALVEAAKTEADRA